MAKILITLFLLCSFQSLLMAEEKPLCELQYEEDVYLCHASLENCHLSNIEACYSIYESCIDVALSEKKKCEEEK